ncbi:MAG: helix-turn-helix transcriptional regulator [Saprospiraceae bacterium]|nr:helix-turn-helix transcriptional regulator [Lewinella sp.]
MRKSAKIPRILKIEAINGYKVYCAFSTGEYRVIDFAPLFEQWHYAMDPLRAQLLEPEIFRTVNLNEGTLQWPSVLQITKLSNGMEFEVPFELDPLVLYEVSEPDEERNRKYLIGSLVRNARKAEGITQEELAQRSGTTKNYISRIENDRSDIELGTLIKIVEIGLGKKLKIQVK